MSGHSVEFATGHVLEIDRLIRSRLSVLGLRVSELARRWGYANSNKGIRRIEQMRAGEFVPDINGMTALSAALEISPDELRVAFVTTRCQIDQLRIAEAEREWLQWCSSFRPHAILRTERERPSPIFVAAFLGPERILRVDLDHSRPAITWPAQVATKLPDQVPAFGKVTGFYLNYSPDRAIEFDLGANAIREFPVARRPGHAWMEHKGRDITSAWKGIMGLEFSTGHSNNLSGRDD